MKRKQNQAQLIKKPLTFKQIQARMGSDGYIKVILALSLDTLGVVRDDLDMLVSELITGSAGALQGSMQGIFYKPVGIKGNNVLVEVSGSVSEWVDNTIRFQERNG